MTNIKATKRALLSSVMALFLCFAMLIGTTYAWFTDEVTSEGNIIQTGSLDVGFEWADGKEDPAAATWTDASKGAIFDYANWEPGYAVARHLKVTNQGTLALNYRMRIVANGIVSKLADVIDVYVIADADAAATKDLLTDNNKIGTLAQVMGTEKNLVKSIAGSLKAGDEADIYTIVLKMQEQANDDYQNMDLGCTFSVQLIATQMSAESDSFDNLYDAEVPNPEIPAALVRPLDDLSVDVGIHSDYGDLEGKLLLDTGYNFHPTTGRPEDPSFGEPDANDGHLPYDPSHSVEDSAYKYWHADFVVKADKDVPANSLALAGYYSFFSNLANDGKWIALTSDTDITAGTEIRLVDAMAGGAITVCWEDICSYGNDGIGFACGAADLTGVNAGTTLTVELYLYETGCDDPGCHHAGKDCEIVGGKSIKVGEFNYTFGHKADYVAEQLAAGANITLLNDVEFDKNTTISIPAGVTSTLDLNGHTISVAADKSGNQELFNVKGNLTVKNGSIEMTAENNQGWGAMAAIFDVTAGGVLNLDGVNAKVSGTDMNFIVHLNNWGTATATITNCDFDLSYVAVRAFNSGNDMNTVTIKNTDVTGGARLFWVHNYTAEGHGDSTLTLDIYGNNNTSENAKPVRFGFSNEVYYDLNGNLIG